MSEQSKLCGIREQALQAHHTLQSGGGLTPESLIECLESLLKVGDLETVRLVLDQLPREAFTSPPILSIFLRFLVVSGDGTRARQFASEIRRDNPDMPHPELANLVNRILGAPTDLASLPEPDAVDYDFDLHDSHYRLIMLIQCDECGCQYVEATGWGLMVLRPTICHRCLLPRLISPDFLVGLLKKYHSSDEQTGLRKIDAELRNLVSNWHLQDDFPEEGVMDRVNLADPLLWPILRELVRNMYKDQYVKSREEARP